MHFLVGASASQALVILHVVVAFGLLVIVHELGHFALARLCGMRVDRFSVGFGPVVLRRRVGETEWAVSAVPFGGYVSISGMSPAEEIAEDDRGAYANHPAWQRLAVIVAGPFMNYVFALLLAVGMLVTLGVPRPETTATIGELSPGGPAEQAGLRPGDRIVSVDGEAVATWADLVSAVVARPGKPARVEVARPGESAPVVLTATPRDAGGRGQLGVSQALRTVRAGTGEAIALAFSLTNERAGSILAGLGQMITGRQKGELKGPVGIAHEMARSARAGAAPFVGIVWLVSIALALFNLLPLPALDGGRFVFLAYELVTRRRVNARVEHVVHLAGFVVLFGLLLVVTLFGDLPGLFHR